MVKVKSVAVHDGFFHADDVFAVAMLKLIYSDLKVVRTRDIEEMRGVDMRVDVGRKYDFDSMDFDHHQVGGAGKRDNRIPFASAGLIWKHFGLQLTNKESWEKIDEKMIQFIDADDEGVNIYSSTIVKPYTIANFIGSMNPIGDYSMEDSDKAFDGAVEIVRDLLKREIVKAERLVESREIVREKLKGNLDGYIVIEENIPYNEVLVNESDLKYVVRYNPLVDTWSVIAIPKRLGEFGNRKDLPEAWGGLDGEELQKVTGVEDATFCHNKLFIAVAKSKEGALKLVRLALGNGRE